ncbi:MAG: glycosyltransferase family 4 protein [Xanthobacteraceae bacterium]|nr:glycosyltransferase family 4 protein [Xanthobacteraceae bacterium]
MSALTAPSVTSPQFAARQPFERLRIVIAHNAYQQSGGEDSCVAAETAMLKAYGHHVVPYTVSNDEIHGMSRMELASRTLWSAPAYRELRALFREVRPHVAHFHNTFPLISPAAYLAARRERVAVVQTLHNYRWFCCNAVFFVDGNICQECLGKLVPWRGVLKRCYRGSRVASAAVAAMIGTHKMLGTWHHAIDTYIALSHASRAKLIEGGLDANRIVVKPNFVYPDPGEGRGGGGYCLYVGRFSAEKGLLTLLQAWRSPGLLRPLKIVGTGPMAAAVEAAAAGNPHIQVLGARAPEAVYDLLGRAEFLIVPSECFETFGRVVAEAFAKGTPVLAADIGGLGEIVADGENGLLFRSGDAADLADKARHLFADPVRLRQMRKRARAAFERNYTVDQNHTRLMSIYQRVLPRDAAITA